ncbi:MAG TPA: cell division protein ZipA C-terminal FtsZ-binding domain-containing protein [Gammaproteobacteria bacterium]|nr:cell division protein ZipA C-terminal FtsZ-binding domain-containing protein [Gammaproteobacteria bacterium]HRA42128.1 cell division protein ZipA C-terminal FtsZ-binding domain-containing protein [Gammaproteobacteria bacterium]
MEMALRFILLFLGAVIVVGIVWDYSRRGRLKKRLEETVVIEPSNKDSDCVSSFDDVRLIVKPEKKEPTLNIQYPEEIVTLNIMARKPAIFTGKKLKSAFADAHLFYGDRQIFHRFDNMDGTGAQLFSVVSSVEPGFFELSTMDTLETPGITLFFITSTPNHSVYAFELMLRTAKQLAIRLEGELKDDRHRVLTSQIIESYRAGIRMQPEELQKMATS